MPGGQKTTDKGHLTQAESQKASWRKVSPAGTSGGREGRDFLFYLHFYIPSKLQLETTKLLQDSLGFRR